MGTEDAASGQPAPVDPLADKLDEMGRAVEGRFNNIRDPLDRVKAEMDAGYGDTALVVMDTLTAAEKADPRFAALHARAVKMTGAGTGDQRAGVNGEIASDFPAKVEKDWLPQIQKVSVAMPGTVDEVWQREGFFDLMAANLDSDRRDDEKGNALPDTPAMAAARHKLRAAIAAKQVRVFPILRRAFVKLSADKMWANNVEVSGSGRNITYTAAMFADNASVQAAQEAGAAELQKLRFSHAQYNWYHGGRVWSYDLKTPSDGAVGAWPSTSFGDFAPVK